MMNARERIMAVLNGKEPDKIPVIAFDWLRVGCQGGWVRRLVKRGLAINRWVAPYKPAYLHPLHIDPQLEDVTFTQCFYIERGLRKCRQTFDTPVGKVTSVLANNPEGDCDVLCASLEEYFIKDRSDWRVMNYIFKAMTDKLHPDYGAYNRQEDELGEGGITTACLEKTPYQRAFVELAGPERTVIDFHEQPEEFLEFIEIQRKHHTRIAEIAAESPAKLIDLPDHITSVISPRYYSEYCIEFYKIYARAFEGTDKIFATHMDGLFGHLKKEISSAPFKIIESFTVPPSGDVSLSEAKRLWPDKIFFVNTPPHLIMSDYDETRKGYERLYEEWGSKKGILFEHSEDIPIDKTESHLTAAMDALDYE